MTITINGAEKTLEQELSITALLEKLDIAKGPVVVELNKEAIFPRDYPSIILKQNDILEIITIAAGG